MQISVLNKENFRAADELRRLAGWNQVPDDWTRLLALEPNGCFAAIEDGRLVGTVTTTTFGRQLAWIGMMLVHPDCRRRGIGTRLMETALAYLRGREVDCIRLDATPAGYPVYEKLGFVREWTLTRCQATAPFVAPDVRSGIRVVAQAGTEDTRRVTETDWPAIEQIDLSVFGALRLPVLRMFAESSRLALVWPAQGPVRGYGMLRPGSQCDYLGPLICPQGDEAVSLMCALLGAAGSRPVFWDMPDQNASARNLARQFGFVPVRPLTRMRIGPNSVRSDPAAQLAIVDPSVG